jgi:thiamine-monophosphate kinase
VEYSGPTIFELGENQALKNALSVFKSVPSTLVGSGDDAAVVGLSDPRFVVTTDTLVQDHDFRLDFSSAFDLGFKAVASNVADVAAMGARPIALTVAMVVTKVTKQSWLEDFARGLQSGLDELAPTAEIVGGDLASGAQIVIAVAAHGELISEPVLRSGARPGDRVAILGTLGKAAAGLDLLMHEDKTLAASYPELVEVQLRPTPPIELALSVAKHATAMMDISDSLALDSSRMAKASSVAINLHSSQLFGYQAVLELAAQSINSRGANQVSEIDWVLFGGEDHSFLVTFPHDFDIPRGFKVVGEVLESRKPGALLDGQPLEAKGWDSVSS